jgi:DNA-binding NtrC family response regulator
MMQNASVIAIAMVRREAHSALLAMGAHVDIASAVCDRSIARWGDGQAVRIVGEHPGLVKVLRKAARYAVSESPVLITGETGTGKELFARAIYLLSSRSTGQFLSINCAQYQDGQLMASELFGHKKGSFTGAVRDHRGVFEAANEGMVFLDEVGELSPQAQAMLLRLLSEGEILPVGETRSRCVDVRTIVATNRNLKAMVDEGRFRADLYYRLRYLQLQIPAVRERGDDWELILEHYLDRLARSGKPRKRFSAEALAVLRQYDWPGNVREIRSIVDTGFHLSDGTVIDPQDFLESLEQAAGLAQFRTALRSIAPQAVTMTASTPAPSAQLLFERLIAREGTFWELVHEPFLERDLNRQQVCEVVARGLVHSGGQYKRLLAAFGISDADYLKFMDFLRHHRLKPNLKPALRANDGERPRD